MNSLLRGIAVVVALVSVSFSVLADMPSLRLTAKHAYVVNLNTGVPVVAKNENVPVSIASLTKLMTALIIAESGLQMQEVIEITTAELKATKESSRSLGLFVGSKYSREELILLALMSSSNRAAAALARTHPAGYDGFVELMNKQAFELEMYDTKFVDPSGLFNDNVSTARDMIKLLQAVRDHPMIGRFSTETFYKKDHTIVSKVKIQGINKKTQKPFTRWVEHAEERTQFFGTTNRLLLTDDWNIHLQKTGVIRASGYCITMIININGEDYGLVILNSTNKTTRASDAIKAKYWIEYRTLPSKQTLAKLNPFQRAQLQRGR